MNLIEVVGLYKIFGADKVALNDVHLEIPEGSIFGLLGPNGAGKTTLIRIINQIYRSNKGEIFFDGEPMTDNHIRNIGYMPEERGLYQKMKVGELLMYLIRLKGLSASEARESIMYWLNRLGAVDWGDKKIDELSKGMQQKIQFVATVAHSPRLLILDEPFSGFDPVNAQLLQDEIFRLREEGTTIIFSSHRMESVENICSHVALIHHASIILNGELKEIQQSFRENHFEAVISGETLSEDYLRSKLPFEFQKLEEVQPGKWRIRFLTTTQYQGNDILHILMKTGNIDSFREVFPTLHDIFIKLVNSPIDAKDTSGHLA